MSTSLSRRSLARGAAWATPALVLASPARSIAVSDPCAPYAQANAELSHHASGTPWLVGTYEPTGVTGGCASQSFYDATVHTVTNVGTVNFLTPYISFSLYWPATADWDTANYPVNLEIYEVLVDGSPVDRSTWILDIPAGSSDLARAWVPVGPLPVGNSMDVIVKARITDYSGVNAGTRPLNLDVSTIPGGLGYEILFVSDIDNQCMSWQSNTTYNEFTSTPATCP